MKKYIAIFCLLTLILTGCGKEEPEKTPETTVATTQAATTLPEQVVSAEESELTGSWTAGMNKGQYAAAIYLQSLELSEEEAAEKATVFKDAEYPLNVTLDLNEDGTYYLEVKPDDGTGFDAFVVSFTEFSNKNGIELTEDDARQMLTDARLDKLFLMNQVEEGTWVHNDQGLVLSGWCTVQFRLQGYNLYWDSTDDPELADVMPLCFKTENA